LNDNTNGCDLDIKKRCDEIYSKFCTDDSDRKMEKAFAEVYQIIQRCTKQIRDTIPNSFMEFLKENMSVTWYINLDTSKELNALELLDETRTLISLVYRDFVVTAEKREELIKKDREELEALGMTYEDESLRDYFES